MCGFTISLQFLCLAVGFFGEMHCLYEDQAGLFDWRQQYIGKAKFIEHMPAGHNAARIIVGTEQNVIAAVSGHNGQIGWRHILEKGTNGRVDDMKVSNTYVVSVLAGGSYIRCFNAVSGSLLWEQSVPSAEPSHHASLQFIGAEKLAVMTHDQVLAFDVESGAEIWKSVLPTSDRVNYVYLSVNDDDADVLHAVGVVAGSHLSVTSLRHDDGSQLSTHLIAAPWIKVQHTCFVANGIHLVCADEFVPAVKVAVLTNKSTSFQTVHLPGEAKYSYNSVTFLRIKSSHAQVTAVGHVIAVSLGARNCVVLVLDDNGNVKYTRHLPGVSAVQVVSDRDQWVLLSVARIHVTNTVAVKGYNLASQNHELTEFAHIITLPAHHGLPQAIHASVVRGNDGSAGFSLLVFSEDYSLVLLDKPAAVSTGKLSWCREEALSTILSVEFVDLPVSQIMAKMEDEFGANDDSIWNLFAKRFMTQFSQLMTFLMQLKQKLRAPRHPLVDRTDDLYEPSGGQQHSLDVIDEDYLTRDEFNLHKIIVAVTMPAKVFGLDSLTGAIVWQYLLPNMKPFQRKSIASGDVYMQSAMPLFVQRTTAHFPQQPVCTVVGSDKETGHVILFTFHPISGKADAGQQSEVVHLHRDILAVVMLAQADEQYLRPLLLLDSQLEYHVYPSSASDLVCAVAPLLFMYVSDAETGTLTGYGITVASHQQLFAEPLWTVDTQKSQQTITNVVAKRAAEHVHSQGIVLEDRSVLYKYLNPNLIAVVTEGEDSQQKGFIEVYLIDAVTGNVVFNCNHKRAKGPVHVIHSENWVVYSYWNQKHRRVELVVLEMYEGNRQSNSTAFSSFHPPPPPIVMRQAYIFPGHVSAMATTVTEKGITNKELLFALETGGVLGLPKMLIDPRRPEVMSPEAREEGLVPYMPELPRPYDRVVNYNQSVFNIRGIHTAPAGLESTSLVLCYGLDLFYTRVMPSKMFDVLKEDFDYFFISSVLLGMIAVSIVSQKLAARRALNRTWK